MFGFLKKKARVCIVNPELERQRDAHAALSEKYYATARDLNAALGFDVDHDAQCWMRNAELMTQYREDIAMLKKRVAALEAADSKGLKKPNK